MKGGAATARAPAPRAPTAAPARQSGPAKPPSTAGSVSAPPEIQRPAQDEDDPFAVDPSVAANAIPAHPKPGPSRTLEVKCPMCETVGYVSAKAAGQQVKCCNPQCMVPVFTAPAPKKAEAPPPPPPPKKLPMMPIAIGVIVVVGLATFGLAKFFTSDVTEFPAAAVVPRTGAAETPEEVAKPAPTAEKAADPRVALVREALARTRNAALNAPHARKAYCRRFSAQAYLSAGDLKSAVDELEQLQKVGQQSRYEGCLPTVQLAWKQLAAAPAAFTSSVAEARRLFGDYGSRGRPPVEGAIAVAAVTAAAGNFDDARKVLGEQQRSPALNQLAAALQVVQNDGSFDLDAPLAGRSVGHWLAPQEAAVALILAAHGRWDDAQAWADKQTDLAARADASLAWAETYARAQAAGSPEPDLQRTLQAAASLGPAAQARLLARLAAVELEAGHRPAAERLVAQSLEILNTLAAPEPMKVSGVRALYELTLPDATPRLAALAATDAAVVQAGLGQREPAWRNFQLALRYLRSAAPSPVFMRQRVADAEGAGADAIGNELKGFKQLRDREQVRRALLEYKEKLGELLATATDRFLAQGDVLQAALHSGIVDPVWEEVQAASSRSDPADQYPLLGSVVAVQVAQAYSALGKADLQQKILAAAQKALEDAPAEVKLPVVRQVTGELVAAGDIPGAISRISAVQNEAGALHEWSLRLACRLVRAGKPAHAFQLVRGLRDVPLREDGLYLVAALSARLGHADEAVKQSKAASVPTEQAVLSAGLVAGLAEARREARPAGGE